MVIAFPKDIEALYPFQKNWFQTTSGKLHYLDEGPKDAPVIVCVHGNPTWSFYWRALVSAFSPTFRVIVPDHIGCGLSDKPKDFSYRLADHTQNLSALLEHLDIQTATFVVHDWGGAIGMGAIVKNPSMASKIIITNTAAFPANRIPPSIAILKIPGFGQLMVQGFNAFAQVATIRATAKGLSPVVKKGLLLPYQDWQSRAAILKFVQDIPMHSTHPSWATLVEISEQLHRLKDKPVKIIWGEQDFCFTPWFRKRWQEIFPAAQVEAWSDVGHYVMEDAPNRMIEVSKSFLTSN